MKGGVEPFGSLPDGRAVHRRTIRGGGLRANVMTYGASIQDLRIDGHAPPLVLGFPQAADYPANSLFFGATVGRYANRIAGGRFSIDGERFQLDRNEATGNTLHGGSDGLFNRIWTIDEAGDDFVRLSVVDPDGAMGFPGNAEISCTYRILPPATLAVTYSATCDRATLCNLAHHSWFNLDDGGAGDVSGHRVAIQASAYLPVGEDLIPTGEVLPVDGTPFGFRRARTIAAPEGISNVAYDHNFCLSAARRPMSQAAWVQAARSGVEMEVWTTEPGLQFFGGAMPPRAVPGLDGIRYGSGAGFCMEPQVWPDSPNRPYFPQALLRPGETYRQATEYRFRLG